jgi:hypothetical protein
MFKQKKGEQETAIDLKLGFESGFLTLTGDGFKFRISREDAAVLVDGAELGRRFDEADSGTSRRIFDAAAAEKFVRIERYLNHGLNLGQASSLIGESESELRSFYSWCISQEEARGEPVKAERKRQGAGDILPLIVPRQGGRMGEEVTEIIVNGLDVKRLLQRDVSKDGKNAAEILGISEADLDHWLDVNSAIMSMLK